MQNKEIGLLDLLLLAAENLRLLIIGPILVCLIVLAHTLTIEPMYRAKTVIIPPSQPQSGISAILSSLGSSGGLGRHDGSLSPIELYSNILKSSVLRDALIDRFKVLERLKTNSRESAHRHIEGSVFIDKRKDGLIGIEVNDTDPEFAAQIANAYVDELKRQIYRLEIEEAQRRRLFFEKQLEIAKDKLISSEKALGDSGINANVLKINGSALNLIAKLKNQIEDQEVKISIMRGYLTDSSPDLKQAIFDLSAIRNELKNTQKNTSASDSDKQGSEYITKLRNYKESDFQFNYLRSQSQAGGIEVAWEGSGIQVLDLAEKPDAENNKSYYILIAKALFFSEILLLLIFVFAHGIIKVHLSDDFNAKKMSIIKEKLISTLYFGDGWKDK